MVAQPMQTYAQPYAPQGYIQPQQMTLTTPPPVAQYPAPANHAPLYPLPPATGYPQQMAGGYVVAQPQQMQQFQPMQPAAPPHQPYVSSGSPLTSAATSSSIIVANPNQLPVGAPLKTLPVTVGPPASVYSAANTYMSSGPASSAYSMPGRSDAAPAPAQPPAVVPVPSVQHHQPAPVKKEDIEDGWELVGEDNSAVSVRDTVSRPLASSASDQKANPPAPAASAPAKPSTASPLGSSGNKPSSPSLTSKLAKGADSSSDTDSGGAQLRELELDTDMYIAWSDISLGRELGSGHFGAVYEAAWRGTTPVAVKMLHAHLKGDAIKNFAEEAKVWLRIPYAPSALDPFFSQLIVCCPSARTRTSFSSSAFRTRTRASPSSPSSSRADRCSASCKTPSRTSRCSRCSTSPRTSVRACGTCTAPPSCTGTWLRATFSWAATCRGARPSS